MDIVETTLKFSFCKLISHETFKWTLDNKNMLALGF